MRTLKQVIDWEHNEVKHGAARWQGLCMSHSRTAWGLPVQAPSAKAFYEWVKAHHRNHLHHTDYRNVPAGAIVLDPNLSKWGHAWIAGGKRGVGFSSDYVRRGHIDRVPLHLPHWRHGDKKVWWTDISQQGVLPVGPKRHPHHA